MYSDCSKKPHYSLLTCVAFATISTDLVSLWVSSNDLLVQVLSVSCSNLRLLPSRSTSSYWGLLFSLYCISLNYLNIIFQKPGFVCQFKMTKNTVTPRGLSLCCHRKAGKKCVVGRVGNMTQVFVTWALCLGSLGRLFVCKSRFLWSFT